MSNRRMALAGVIAVLVGVLVWWISGAVRSSSRTTAKTAVPQQAVWHARAHDETTTADPAGDLRLEGQVIDEQQQPVAGATVMLVASPMRIVESEQDGSFVFEGLRATTYRIAAFKDIARAAPQDARVTADSEPVILRMRDGITLAVTVIDRETHAPIAGATVTIGDLFEQSATTDASGRAELRGLGSWLTFVNATADGYAPGGDAFTLPEDPGGTFEHTVELGRGAAVSGIVIDPDGGRVPGAAVYGIPSEWTARVGARTGADGTWTIPAVPAGEWGFGAQADPFAPGGSDPMMLDGKTPVTGIEIRLERGARIVGVVVDPTDAPVPDAKVTVAPALGDPITVIAGDDGRFEVVGLWHQRYLVRAMEGQRSSAQLTADVRTADVVDLRVAIADAMISGIVVDASGEPIAEASVSGMQAGSVLLFSEHTGTITDSAGHWTIGPLSSKTYRLHADWPGAAGNMYLLPELGTARPGDHDVKLVLPASATIRGTVVRGGAPVTRYAIDVGHGMSGFETPTMTRHADGTFERAGLPPGTYTVTIGGADFATKEVTGIAVVAGEVKDVGAIEVEAGRTVRGTIVDASGAPVAGATVAVAMSFYQVDGGIGLDEDPMKDALLSRPSTHSGADGRFELAGIPVTTRRPLQVLADKPGVGRSTQLELPAGDAELTLTLLATGTIAVTVVGAPEVVSLYVRARQVGTQTLVAGSVGYADVTPLDGVVPGTWEVQADLQRTTGGLRTSPVSVEVRSGETASVTVAFAIPGITVMVEAGAACEWLTLAIPGDADPHDPRSWVANAPGNPDAPFELEQIEPGDYRLCCDSCTPITVRPSPDRQTFTVK